MSTVFHRFKHVVLIVGDVAGIAAAVLLAAGVASAAKPTGLLQSDQYGIEAAENRFDHAAVDKADLRVTCVVVAE